MHRSPVKRKGRRFNAIQAGIGVTILTGLADGRAGVVTSVEDSGPGSLRGEIADADPGDTITFAPALDGAVITLGSGQLAIEKDLVIDASALANPVTINANGAVTGHRVFRVSEGVTVVFEALVITGGRFPDEEPADGGGIYNAGHLNLRDTTVTGNTTGEGEPFCFCISIWGSRCDEICVPRPGLGGGIYNSGSLTIRSSTISGNLAGGFGGGVYNSGSLHIGSSTISGNRTIGGGGDFGGSGGGVCNAGTLTIERSTISGNITGNGPDYGGSGGGIFNGGGTLNLRNVTVSENTTGQGGFHGGYGAGIYNNGGILTVQNATVTGNTTGQGGSASGHVGGIFLTYAGTLTLENSLVADNHAGVGEPNIAFEGRTVVLEGNNLIDGSPLLAPLGDYGGPTLTMPPLPGSPAIEAGILSANTAALDQRGAPRISGSAPDLGAVEAVAFVHLSGLEDTDADTIPDLLEPVYGFTIGEDDREADTDRDGHTDASEIANMTDPLDPHDRFRLLSMRKAGNFSLSQPRFLVTAATFPGLEYEFETTQDLRADFTPIPGSRFLADSPSSTFQVLLASDRAFVRVRRK